MSWKNLKLNDSIPDIITKINDIAYVPGQEKRIIKINKAKDKNIDNL